MANGCHPWDPKGKLGKIRNFDPLFLAIDKTFLKSTFFSKIHFGAIFMTSKGQENILAAIFIISNIPKQSSKVGTTLVGHTVFML